MRRDLHKKAFSVAIKVLLSAAAIYLVLQKIDFTKTKDIFSTINYFWLTLGFIAFTLSRIIGAIRLNLYFSQIGLHLPAILNLKLYYLGMFYNLFLPGGIGGDGYKIYFLHKYYHTKKLLLLKATLLDRISGLFALIFLACIFLSTSSFTEVLDIGPLLCIIASLLVIPASYLFALLTSKTFMPIFTLSSLYALVLQALQGLTTLFILYAFAHTTHISD
ncbi:MAG TPA: flippase-like domain-containing protein, partial [Epsilonproteobacteria bacterium]|nr:flippase-like domain-containing protein [Campylobacterota bacterium]